MWMDLLWAAILVALESAMIGHITLVGAIVLYIIDLIIIFVIESIIFTLTR